MQIEIITIGSELLSGKTLNTNLQYLCRSLLSMGYSCKYSSSVCDYGKDIQEALKIAFARSDIIILTGGLGPTLDDNTKKIVADFLNLPLECNEDIAQDIEKRFKNLSSKENQATIIQGSNIFPNDIGTAYGLSIKQDNKEIFLLPGVPIEMKDMFEKQIKKYLLKNYPLKEKFFQKIVGVCLKPEVEVDKILRGIDVPKDVELGIYPALTGIEVSISAKAKDESVALDNIKKVKNQINEKLQGFVFESCDNTLKRALHDILIKTDKKIAFAESCSGGKLSSEIVSMPGSSKYFLGSFITYSNELKKDILDVNQKTLEKQGAVSQEVVEEMVIGVFDKTKADYAIAISGIAGPSGETLEKPVGTVCIAIGKSKEDIDAKTFHFQGDRELIIALSVNYALGLLYQKLCKALT